MIPFCLKARSSAAARGPVSLSSGVTRAAAWSCQCSEVESPNGYLSECNNVNLLVVILRGKNKKNKKKQQPKNCKAGSWRAWPLLLLRHLGPFRCLRAGHSLQSASPPGPGQLRRWQGGPGQGQGQPTIAHLTPSPVSSLTARALGWRDRRLLCKRGFPNRAGVGVFSFESPAGAPSDLSLNV